jgi:hypothetical protein
MAAPQFVPTLPLDKVRGYQSPDSVPTGWMPDRPGEIDGPQPEGERLGYQGPDQGYALTLMERVATRMKISSGESLADAKYGILGVALRRASIFGRAPVIHDLNIAATIWGLFDAKAPADLLALRHKMFEGVSMVVHHYAEARAIADLVPEATLRMTHQDVAAAYPGRWQELLGV